MKWNREEVAKLLEAEMEDSESTNGQVVTIVRFRDERMQCELWINENSVFLGADPSRPISGLPLFEICFPCDELAPISRSGMPTGIGMYAGPGPHSVATLRFSITRREDGYLSLSGAWDGWTAPHTKT